MTTETNRAVTLAIKSRINRLCALSASLELLGDHDAATLTRARARLWYREWRSMI